MIPGTLRGTHGIVEITGIVAEITETIGVTVETHGITDITETTGVAEEIHEITEMSETTGVPVEITEIHEVTAAAAAVTVDDSFILWENIQQIIDLYTRLIISTNLNIN